MNQDEIYIRGALTKAFLLGQVYWQQADSEYESQWKKADITREKYNELLEEAAAEFNLFLAAERAAGYQKALSHYYDSDGSDA